MTKRGCASQFDLVEVVNAILYKLKSGCQWGLLPMGHLLLENLRLSLLFKHYRKWCKKGDWETAFSQNVKDNRDKVGLSLSHIDGSHTPAYRGGEKVEYQGRNKRSTTNALYFVDRHGQRKTLPITEIQGAGCLSLLASLIFNVLPTSLRRGLGTINMGDGHIKFGLIPLDGNREHGLPLSGSAPFPEMMTDGIPSQYNIAEEMTHRELIPLASAFKLMENRVDDLNKASLRDISSFCYAQMWHNFFFYCIFVEYSVFRHWFGKLKCCTSNIANFVRNTLYFYILQEFLRF